MACWRKFTHKQQAENAKICQVECVRLAGRSLKDQEEDVGVGTLEDVSKDGDEFCGVEEILVSRERDRDIPVGRNDLRNEELL